MDALALVLAAALEGASPVPPRADSLAALPRAVIRLQEFVVVGSALHDPFSSQSVHRIRPRALRSLPVDDLAGLLSLQAGVVARGEDLHVRGGRAGELAVEIEGIALNEPFRRRGPELPLLAIREAELVSGGLEAGHGGALGGVLAVRTVEPGARWSGELQWQTDGRLGTHHDRIAGRLGGPLPGTALGMVASAEVQLDDTALPSLRTASRRRVLGAAFGWRADNRMRGHLKLQTRDPSRRVALELLGSRRVDRPYDPMWTLDGWTRRAGDPFSGQPPGPAYSPTPLPGFERYRAADHLDLTDDRHLTSILSWSRAWARARLSTALAWSRSRTITSIDGLDDESQLALERAPEFGFPDTTLNDPFHVYAGDEPFFRKATSDVVSLRAAFERASERGDAVQVGAGATWEEVFLRELDLSSFGLRVDSLRTFRAAAPGAFAFGQFRWIAEGLIVNGGLRAEYFSPGADARSPSTGTWSLSPRLGLAYPVSVRDVFSLSYVRVRQFPGREYLYENRSETTNRGPLGNPELGPATLISYQGALKHLIARRFWVQAAYFYRDVFDLVGARNTRPALEVPLLRYQNADDAHASGVELTLGGERGALEVELGYTYLHARGTASREEGVPFGPRMRRRPETLGQHPLDWDRRHTATLSLLWQPGSWSVSWSTLAASGLPWTPRERRADEADLARENSRRLAWEEWSALAVRWHPPRPLERLTLGLEVRNVFDHRADLAATADGYPNPVINTLYDDYGAHRTETGQRGGAYYNDRDGDGLPGWVPVHDPRLAGPPRAIRFSVGAAW